MTFPTYRKLALSSRHYPPRHLYMIRSLVAHRWTRSNAVAAGFQLFGAANASRTSGRLKGHKSPAQFGEETRRQKAISDGAIVAVANAPQIRTGPFEQIAFIQHDPGPLGVEAEMLLDSGWQFERFRKI